MRKEVRIGLVVCVALAGVVAMYFIFFGPAGQTDSTQTTNSTDASDTVVADAPQPVQPPDASSPPPRPAPVSRALGVTSTPTNRTSAPGLPAVANRSQRLGTRDLLPTKADARKVVTLQPGLTDSPGARTGAPVSPPPARLRVLPNPRASRTTTYTVTADDRGFYIISQKVYGSSRHAHLIGKANPGADSRRLRVGQKLTIPPLPTETAAATPAGGAGGSTIRLPSGDRQYVVAANDSCYTLARKFYGDGKYMNLIVQANPDINPDRLSIGQKLVIPKRVGAARPLTSSAGLKAPTAGPGQKVYTIADGDLLGSIAKREYGSAKYWPAIVKANPGLNPNRLPIGSKILLPSAVEVGKSADAAGRASSAGGRSTGAASEYVAGKPYFE